MLWPQWSLRLAEQNLFQRFLRSVLSVGLLLIGNDIEVEEAIESLGCPASTGKLSCWNAQFVRVT